MPTNAPVRHIANPTHESQWSSELHQARWRKKKNVWVMYPNNPSNRVRRSVFITASPDRAET